QAGRGLKRSRFLARNTNKLSLLPRRNGGEGGRRPDEGALAIAQRRDLNSGEQEIGQFCPIRGCRFDLSRIFHDPSVSFRTSTPGERYESHHASFGTASRHAA